MEVTYEEEVKVFKAFCDEKRLRILELLRSGEKCACILAEQSNMAQSTLSYHIFLVPPKEMLAEAILRNVFGLSKHSCTCSDYELPENLRHFLEERKIQNAHVKVTAADG